MFYLDSKQAVNELPLKQYFTATSRGNMLVWYQACFTDLEQQVGNHVFYTCQIHIEGFYQYELW